MLRVYSHSMVYDKNTINGRQISDNATRLHHDKRLTTPGHGALRRTCVWGWYVIGEIRYGVTLLGCKFL
jgi:hypothetical protein